MKVSPGLVLGLVVVVGAIGALLGRAVDPFLLAQDDPFPPEPLPVPAWLKVVTWGLMLIVVALVVVLDQGLPEIKRRWGKRSEREGDARASTRAE